MARYLAFMSEWERFEDFRQPLPILGRDGTLHGVLPDSPAAGKVFGKSGTMITFDQAAGRSTRRVTGRPRPLSRTR